MHYNSIRLKPKQDHLGNTTVARKEHYNIFFLLKLLRDNFNLSRDKFKLSRDNFELSRDNFSVYRAINLNYRAIIIQFIAR